MRIRYPILLRLARFVLVAVLAWVAFNWLEPRGQGWVVFAVVTFVALAYLGLRVRAGRRQRAEEARAERWAEALMSAPRRPAAIERLEEELASMKPRGRTLGRYVRRALALAELYDADEEPRKALQTLERVPVDDLDPRTLAVLRHGRAMAWLSAGEPARAREVLDEGPAPAGDRTLALRFTLLRALIEIEGGEAERGLERVEEARHEVLGDEELEVEVKMTRAAALDALGDRRDALKVLSSVSGDLLGVLELIGLPRVRALAAEAREGLDESEAER